MKKVLLIEDDEFFRDLISNKVKSGGFDVAMAVDGVSGYNKVKSEKPDLVLLDLLLPGGMDGFDILSKKKDDDEIVDIPVLVLSNLDQKESITMAMNLGAKGYLIKSQLNIDEILEKVKSVFE